MTTALTEFSTNGGKHSASSLSYRRYGCCLCTTSGLKNLFDFDTSIRQNIRESASFSHFSLQRNHHDYHSLDRPSHLASASSHEEDETLSYKLAISGGIIWFIQYFVYSILLSIYPIKYVNVHSHNIYGVAIIIVLIPLSSILFIPICHKYCLIYKLGLFRCIVIGLLLQGILCIIFQFIPNMVPHPHSNSTLTRDATICSLNAVIRILSSFLSTLIELSFISIIVQVTPPQVLNGQQCMPLFSMIGLMSGPIISGYLYCFKYEIPFAIIGIMIIISALILYRYIPRNINTISNIRSISYLSAFTNMNIIYSSIIAIYSLICITYVMFCLSFYLHKIKDNHSITTYYFILGISYIILSFPTATITYRNCGSLRTMLSGMFMMSIGLLLVSTTTYVFPLHLHNRLDVIAIGLVIVGISTAFSVTPYLLYIRNAIYRKYKNETTEASFDIYRVSVCLGISIGPIVGCLTFPIDNNGVYHIQLTLFILSLNAAFISIAGFILFKCLRWKIQQKNDKMKQESNYEIKYIPILQDDKACCFCHQMMCFFSFGALVDPHFHLKRKKKKRIKRGRMRARRSFDETLTFKISPETDDIIKVRKKTPNIYDRISFDGSNVDSEYAGMYGNNGKTVTKDDCNLAQSWNTILNNKTAVLNIAAINLDRSTSGSESLTREKSRILTADDIHTPRGDTAKAISHSQKRNANVESVKTVTKSKSNNSDNDNDEDVKTSDAMKTRETFDCVAGEMQSQIPNIAVSRRSFSGSFTPLDPRTPMHPSYARALSHGETFQSSTEPPSQTFMLLSDEDFISKYSSDIYKNVSETQEESNTQ